VHQFHGGVSNRSLNLVFMGLSLNQFTFR